MIAFILLSWLLVGTAGAGTIPIKDGVWVPCATLNGPKEFECRAIAGTDVLETRPNCLSLMQQAMEAREAFGEFDYTAELERGRKPSDAKNEQRDLYYAYKKHWAEAKARCWR